MVNFDKYGVVIVGIENVIIMNKLTLDILYRYKIKLRYISKIVINLVVLLSKQ